MEFAGRQSIVSSAAVVLAVASLSLTRIPIAEAESSTERFQRIDARNVDVGGEFRRRIDVTIKNHLLKIDIDHLLEAFKAGEEREGGFRGLGMIIDSAVVSAAYTRDPEVIAFKEELIRKTIAAQEGDGYVGLFPKGKRMWWLWDVHERSYIALGLANDYLYFGEEESLEAAKKLVGLIITRWEAEPHREIEEVAKPWHAAGGLNEACLALYRATGEEKYIDFIVDHRGLAAWDEPMIYDRRASESHSYAYVGQCLAQLDLYRLRPDEHLLECARKAMRFMAAEEGTTISGGCGQGECWNNTQAGGPHLAETCHTTYLLYFLDNLLRLFGDSYYGDFMERIIYNTMFAAESPDGSQLRHYTNLEGYGRREYHYTDPRVYWCCNANFRRLPPRLPGMVYYRTDDGLAVNLYVESMVTTELASGTGVTIRQETDYPNSGTVRITVSPDKARRFPLNLRIPRWCQHPTVSVNGARQVSVPQTGRFYTIEREWQPGDTVDLRMPMELRLVKGRIEQRGKVAVMRGPVLFALRWSDEDEAQGIKYPFGLLDKVDKEDRGFFTKLDDREREYPLFTYKIDPDSFDGPFRDTSVRPDGMAYTVAGWGPDSDVEDPDLRLTLTEFTDPYGIATYFHIPDMNHELVVDDELFGPGKWDSTSPTVPVWSHPVQTESGIELRWDAAHDPESGIYRYRIYADGHLVGESRTNMYALSRNELNTVRSYQVSAVNMAEVEGAKSVPLAFGVRLSD